MTLHLDEVELSVNIIARLKSEPMGNLKFK